jgi:hypothetical protein
MLPHSRRLQSKFAAAAEHALALCMHACPPSRCASDAAPRDQIFNIPPRPQQTAPTTHIHTAEHQRQRRSVLARLRNSLVALALGTEDAVLWVDSDVTSMPRHTLAALVDSGKDVVTTITKGCVGRPGAAPPRRSAPARHCKTGDIHGVGHVTQRDGLGPNRIARAPTQRVGAPQCLLRHAGSVRAPARTSRRHYLLPPPPPHPQGGTSCCTTATHGSCRATAYLRPSTAGTSSQVRRRQRRQAARVRVAAAVCSGGRGRSSGTGLC